MISKNLKKPVNKIGIENIQLSMAPVASIKINRIRSTKMIGPVIDKRHGFYCGHDSSQLISAG
jgi:hypothetical protein